MQEGRARAARTQLEHAVVDLLTAERSFADAYRARDQGALDEAEERVESARRAVVRWQERLPADWVR